MKKEVADIVVEKLMTIQKKYQEYMDSGIVDEFLNQGRMKVEKFAKQNYEEVMKKLGLGRN